MTTNPLDDIEARHDRLAASYKSACSCCNPPKSHVDRGKLLAALRAVEAVHSRIPSGPDEFVGYCRTCSAEDLVAHPCPTITAIREALG